MRTVAAGMTTALLLAALAASAVSAQDTDSDLHSTAPKPKAWYEGWFATTSKPSEHAIDADAAPVAAGPSPLERAAEAHRNERAALDRRWEVCDRLMEIAVRNNDAAMQAQVEQLRDRAWEVYQQKTSGASVSDGSPAAPADAAMAAGARPKFRGGVIP